MNLSPVEPYVYEPLLPGYIRILYLTSSPSQPFTASNQQLSFSLKSISLTNTSDTQHVEYDSLSYAWGDPSDETYPLICDGRVIQIQRNLYIALPYLMRRPSNRPMWIDAVCIDQKDTSEKLVQIGMMSDVYRRATKVWIWLKPAPPELLEAAKEAVGYISRIGQAGIDSYQLEEGTFTTNQLGLPPSSSPAWNIIIGILEAPWFTRMWIIQEFALAKSVTFLFGDHVISSENLQAANNLLHTPRRILDNEGRDLVMQLDNSGPCAMPFFCRDQYLKHSRDSFDAAGLIIFLTMGQRCYDPRDRVFALLGLFEHEELSGFRFDNKTSLPELYAGFVWFLLYNRTHKATWRWMLCFAIETGKPNSEFPSWCPDFHQLHQMKRVEVATPGHLGAHRASKSQMSRRKGRTWREMVLRGCVFDTVQSVGESMTETFKNTTADLRWWVEVHRWETQAAEMLSQSGNLNFTESAFRLGIRKLTQSCSIPSINTSGLGIGRYD
jgi:hypothetical protein